MRRPPAWARPKRADGERAAQLLPAPAKRLAELCDLASDTRLPSGTSRAVRDWLMARERSALEVRKAIDRLKELIGAWEGLQSDLFDQEGTMKFTKIRYRNGETVLKWDDDGDSCHHKHELVSQEAPEPEFRAALAALVPHVAELLELPPSYAEHLEVTGVSLRYGEDDRYGAVVTCVKELEDGDSPWVINTPHRKSRDIDDERPSLSEGFEAAIDHAIAMAERFVDGKRAQQDLFNVA